MQASGSVAGGAVGSQVAGGGDASMYGTAQNYEFGGLGTVYDEEEWYQ